MKITSVDTSSDRPLNTPADTLLEWLEWALLGLGMALLILIEVYQPDMTVIFGALLGAFTLRVIRTRRFLPRTGMELPLGLFMASAALSAWVAYDRSLALLQLANLLAAAVAFLAVAESGRKMRRLAALGVVAFAAALGVFFVFRHDFSLDIGKVAPITAVGLRLNALLPAVPGPEVHPNVAGAVLSLTLPLAVALTVESWKAGLRWLAGLTALLGSVGLAAVVLTSSRGAWLGLFGALGLGVLVIIQRRWLPRSQARRAFWLGLGGAALLMIVVLFQTGMFDQLAGRIPDSTGALQSRSTLLTQGLLLARDAPFTGIGLLSFPMVFSTYTLLIHPFFVWHTHNTYLQVLVEQGWPGLIALLGMGWVALRWAWTLLKHKNSAIITWGALAALSAFAIHQVFDSNIYLNRPLPLLGLVAGILAAGVKPYGRRKRTGRKPALDTVGLAAILTGGLVGVIALGLLFWQPLTAAAYANLGAVRQTRLELGQYDPQRFDNPTLDHIRQTSDLGPAQDAFRQALALAPNLTARQRLASIALSRGEYQDALKWMEAAWVGGARDEVTRLLYGDALVANGYEEAAAVAVRGITRAEGRLMFQAYYRYTLGEDYPRAIAAWQAVLLLNPDNTQAQPEIARLQDLLSTSSD